MIAAQRRHPFSCEAIAASGAKPVAAKHTGNEIIGTDLSQCPYRADEFRWRLMAVLSAASPWQAQLCMHTAFPMD